MSAHNHIERLLSPQNLKTGWASRISNLKEQHTGAIRVASNSGFTQHVPVSLNPSGSLLRSKEKSHRRGLTNIDSTLEGFRQSLHTGHVSNDPISQKLKYMQKTQVIDSIWSRHGSTAQGLERSFQGKSTGYSRKLDFGDLMGLETPHKMMGLGSPKYKAEWRSHERPSDSRDVNHLLASTSAGKLQSLLDRGGARFTSQLSTNTALFSGIPKRRGSGLGQNRMF